MARKRTAPCPATPPTTATGPRCHLLYWGARSIQLYMTCVANGFRARLANISGPGSAMNSSNPGAAFDPRAPRAIDTQRSESGPVSAMEKKVTRQI